VLYQEHLIYTVDLTGTAQGLSTTGIGADLCEAEVATALPYLVVEMVSGSPVVTDANGDFVFPDVVAGPIDIYAFLDGMWFDVDNVQGVDAVEFLSVTPPDRADLLFNTDNTDELVRAQVNAYVHANRIRDFVLDYNPAYPALGAVDFPINVNRTDGFCPGNAWYDPAGGGSINFCASQGSSPNTAWSSVIYHEYGHHLVNVAGSGQCEYGEGLGDTMSVLMLDDPEIGVGFFGSCFTSLRSADVDCQYSPTSCTTNCGDECHLCGRLLAASVWSTRNELIVTHPGDYIDILSGLMVNSILLHVGTSITPDIALDLLVLDDDDADLCNGTPHSAEIIAGFAAHGLVEESFDFSLTEPLPTVIDPAGGTTVRVGVCGPVPPPDDAVTLNVFAPELGGYFNFAMTLVAPGVYEGAFPERDCGEAVLYFFRADLPSGGVQFFPENAPSNAFVTMSAASVEIALTDDFETDQGWTVSGSSVAGTWERGVPITNTICDAGNPDTDGDGSGQCFVTDNDPLTCPSDVDGGTTILTSPVMDVTGGLPALTYLEWFHNTSGSSLFEDHFTIDASNDGGKTWTNVQTIGSGGFPVIGAWRQRAHRLAGFVTPTDQFRVRFTASDIGTDATVEAAVDGVQLLLASCGPLTLGDLDGDGIVGIADFLALLGAWGPCDVPCPPSCVADLDDDCTVGINDFLILLANWTT
jgi:hypothetical protein